MGNLATAAAVIEVLAIIVWVGGLTSLVLLAAPAIFQTIPTRELAGETFRSIRWRLDRLGVACGAAILLGAVLRYAGRPAPTLYGDEVTRYLIAGVMLALTLYHGWSVAPRLAKKREGDETVGDERLHGLSLTLTAFTLLLGLVLGILFGLERA
ncbi:MAG: DUF4149 domain-containing protein [Blastocatellia bacterium]